MYCKVTLSCWMLQKNRTKRLAHSALAGINPQTIPIVHSALIKADVYVACEFWSGLEGTVTVTYQTSGLF